MGKTVWDYDFMCPSQAKALLNLKQMLSWYLSTSASEELKQMPDTQMIRKPFVRTYTPIKSVRNRVGWGIEKSFL